MLFRHSFRRHRDGLRRCPECTGRLVCPIDWEPEGDGHWSIGLRCGDCAHSWNRVVPNARAARYDLELDRDADVLQRALRGLERERMAADVETFIAALARDLVEPADFAL
jgi:hypothetical protein